MKTLRIVFIGLVCAGLMTGCSKSEWTGDELVNAALKEAPVTETIISVGLPNGENDTEAFLAAFAKTAGKINPVVQLEEGVYHLDFVEIREFCGVFRGMGMGKSVISTIAGLSDVLVKSLNRKVVLVKFVGGDVTVRDMTMTIPPAEMCPGVSRFHGIVQFCTLNPQYTSVNAYINAHVDHVEITGHLSNVKSGIRAETDYNAKDNTVPYGAPHSIIDISVTNCYFNGLADYGILIQHFKGGNIVIGRKNNGNLFDNISWAGVGLWSSLNVEALVEGNTFVNPTNSQYGIDLNNSPYLGLLEPVQQNKVSVYKIQHNEFYLTGGATKKYEAAIYTEDLRRTKYPEEEMPALVEVKNNKFNLINNPYSVFRTFHMSGMVIRNNQFNGDGQYGVMIRSNNPSVLNENGLMLGNNLANATFSKASVYLDTNTRNWTLVGGNLGETVVDLTNGAGNHLITGMNVNTSEEALGQRISDNLEEMREASK